MIDTVAPVSTYLYSLLICCLIVMECEYVFRSNSGISESEFSDSVSIIDLMKSKGFKPSCNVGANMACTMNIPCLLAERISWNNGIYVRVSTGHEIK